MNVRSYDKTGLERSASVDKGIQDSKDLKKKNSSNLTPDETTNEIG